MKHKRGYISPSLRLYIYKRDNFTCQYCGAHAYETELEIDHIIPVCYGGNEIADNLRTSCVKCNRKKHDNVLFGTNLYEISRILRLMIPCSSIINCETGRREPKIGDIEKLALTLGTSVESLMGFNDGKENQEDGSVDLITMLNGLMKNYNKDKTTLSAPQGLSYWGGVVDNAREVVLRNDTNEMEEVFQMLHRALSLVKNGLTGGKDISNGETSGKSLLSAIPSVSAYNGHNSSYLGTVMNVGHR